MAPLQKINTAVMNSETCCFLLSPLQIVLLMHFALKLSGLYIICYLLYVMFYFFCFLFFTL